MQEKTTLTLAAAALKRSSVVNYNELVEALAAYTEVSRSNCVGSPLEQLPVNQGRAQALTALTEIFRNAVSDADKINNRTRT